MFTPAPRQGRVSLAYSLAPLSGGYQHTGEVVPQHSKRGWPDDEGVPPRSAPPSRATWPRPLPGARCDPQVQCSGYSTIRATAFRDLDVEKPVRREGLTLDEVEEVLNTWKLRGPHGGCNGR
jgi:hypothetical protein